MSRKLSRRIYPERKIHISADRPLPEPADEVVPAIHHPFGEKVDTFSLSELEENLPREPSSKSQASLKFSEDFNQQNSYYGHNESDDGSNIWDEYWFPSESDSDLSQSAASFMSWTDDIEVETTRKLQAVFDRLESFLYDEAPAPKDLSTEMLAECLQWKAKFPHIRVVGTAIRPPPGFRRLSGIQETEQIIAIDQSDSDDETIQGSPRPSFVELAEETERFLYDDVTMGAQCPSDGNALRGKVEDSVMAGLFAHVASKLAESCEAEASLHLDHRDLNRVTSSRLSEMTISERREANSSHRANRRNRAVDSRNQSELRHTERLSSSQYLNHREQSQSRAIESNRAESREASSRSLSLLSARAASHGRLPAAGVVSAASVSHGRAIAPSTSRLLIHAPPPPPRAYHSAAIRPSPAKAMATRRLHSFAGDPAAVEGKLPRQDTILREIREAQLRLSGTGDGFPREKPRSNTWSGGRHLVLPPLESRPRDAVTVESSAQRSSPPGIQVNGTGLPSVGQRDVTLRKYAPLAGIAAEKVATGGSSSKLVTERRKMGRL